MDSSLLPLESSHTEQTSSSIDISNSNNNNNNGDLKLINTMEKHEYSENEDEDNFDADSIDSTDLFDADDLNTTKTSDYQSHSDETDGIDKRISSDEVNEISDRTDVLHCEPALSDLNGNFNSMDDLEMAKQKSDEDNSDKQSCDDVGNDNDDDGYREYPIYDFLDKANEVVGVLIYISRFIYFFLLHTQPFCTIFSCGKSFI